MPPPTQPSLTAVRIDATTFRASSAGGDAGLTQRLYYRPVGGDADQTGPTRVGNGVFADVTGLTSSGVYWVWLVVESAANSGYSLPAHAQVSLADPENVTGAIHALWYGSPALVAKVSGGLWTGEVPEGTEPPYCWLDLPSVATNPIFVDEFESARAIFRVYAVGAQSAEECAAELKAAFDYASLSFSAASTRRSVGLWPRSYRLLPELTRYKDGTLVYQVILSYDLLLQRDRA